jgi:hypothetical protein
MIKLLWKEKNIGEKNPQKTRQVAQRRKSSKSM